MNTHPRPNMLMTVLTVALLGGCMVCSIHAADKAAGKTNPASPAVQAPQRKKKKKTPKPFAWVNEFKRTDLPGVKHGTFKSPSMMLDVGYCIYLPTEYSQADKAQMRFPVVYYLHGGRPGSETRSITLAKHIHAAQSQGKLAPMIYVFVNGGPVSHYNLPKRDKAMGEDVFIKELIPHIDKTYRTIADRNGRGLEGFSQGGRGTARIMFKHAELFCSAAAGGGGYATEKSISENQGKENDKLIFAIGYNTWDLARKYAKAHAQIPKPQVRIMRRMIFVGTKGFNYENNLAYMKFLESLKIPFEKIIVQDAPHSANLIYEKKGLQIMRFHADNFKNAQIQK
jgi:enterochelin esterase-like enzyme